MDKKALTDLLVEYGNERATLRLLKASFIDEPGDMMCDLSVSIYILYSFAVDEGISGGMKYVS